MSYDPKANGCRCDVCPLAERRSMVPPAGTTQQGFVVVGDSPGLAEVKAGAPFVGATGFKLDAILSKAGTRRADVWLTNTILCRTEVPDQKGRHRYDIRRYMAWLRKENAKIKKLGGVPLQSPFDCCRPRLLKELWDAEDAAREAGAPNGAVVVPLGNFAAGTLLGMEKNLNEGVRPVSVMKYRGSVISVKLPEEK